VDEQTARFLVLIRRALENEPSKAASGVWAASMMALAHQDCRSASQWLREFIADELADEGTGASAEAELGSGDEVGASVLSQIPANTF
jgi:hypothetical protein